MKSFKSLGLPQKLLSALAEIGYESPSPIQTQGIPVLLKGLDIIAQAQTGTGKTATFALPILSQIDLSLHAPQALVIAPTRELAIQVAEAFQSYAKHLEGFHVLPIYGGQEYRRQLRALKRGAHVIVGTPGRIMDHIDRGTLVLDELRTIALDEADEMLKMGFIEDVEWILEHIPDEHQTALFSATMPKPIQKIATRYTNNPVNIHIKPETKTVEAIEQYYMQVANHNKMEALTRFLELEDFDGSLIFTRTKVGTTEVAQKLEARGYQVSALNGDMNQAAREKVIQGLKKNKIDIVVATEVAARGIDVDRLSLVVNYDIPQDPESYVHRIGRTGRAGRTGKALTLVTPRESYMLKTIERTIKKRLEAVYPPSAKQISRKRVEEFKRSLLEIIQSEGLSYYAELVETLAHESEHDITDVAAALAYYARKGKPLHFEDTTDFSIKKPKESSEPNKKRSRRRGNRPRHFEENYIRDEGERRPKRRRRRR